MVEPDPFAGATQGRGLLEHLSDTVSRMRAVPPGADAEQRVANHEVVAVHREAITAQSVQPVSGLLAGDVAGIQVVVAGAHQQARLARDGGEAGR
jgi:hypothetical protein